MKKISIIIPFSHYIHYLEECLDSLKVSAFQDFETLLVVDKEHDNVDPIIKKYPFVRLIQTDVHGVAACRNVGLAHAQGEYVYFLDADDYVLENTLGLLAEAAKGQDIVYGRVAHTWNNKANYLEKIENKEIDPEDEEEKEQMRQQKIDSYKEKNPNVDPVQLRAVY